MESWVRTWVMNCVAAGAHLPTLDFEPAKQPVDRADYSLSFDLLKVLNISWPSCTQSTENRRSLLIFYQILFDYKRTRGAVQPSDIANFLSGIIDVTARYAWYYHQLTASIRVALTIYLFYHITLAFDQRHPSTFRLNAASIFPRYELRFVDPRSVNPTAAKTVHPARRSPWSMPCRASRHGAGES